MSHYPAETGGLDPAGAGEPAGRSPASRPGFFSRLGTGWRRYRAWRRSRPFWAGIWLVIAGAELLLIPLPIHSMGLILHIGIGGISGILIGAILVLLGLLLWVHPAQRLFYSIVAALLAVAALVASNLGGFLLGTVLGIIGASLGFAWMPGRPERRRRRRQTEPAGPDSDTEAGVTPGSGREPGTIVRGVAVLPLIAMLLGLPQFLANVVAADPSPGATASATPDPSASPSPAPSVSPPAPPPSPATTTPPAASSSPESSSAASTSPAASSGGSASPGESASPSPVPSGTPPPIVVATAQATLTASSATLTGLSYDGVVTVPTAAGSVQLMQFSATSIDLSGVQLVVSQGDVTATTTASSLNYHGNVLLYTTELSGELLGAPVTLTPSTPLATILQLLGQTGVTQALPLQLTNVTTRQPYTSADGLTATSLLIS